MAATYKMLIGGELVAGAEERDVIGPASEAPVGSAARASAMQVDTAIAAAKEAFPAWKDTALDERRACLIAIADRIKAHSEELARLITLEVGKPLKESMGEVLGAAAFYRYFSGLSLDPRRIEDKPNRRVDLLRRPLGVVAMIMPWNFPFFLTSFKIPPALLSGNTIVLKPSAGTPLATLHFASLVQDLLPAGVLNVIADNNDQGAHLASHPDVRKVAFTGSTATGSRIMAGAASTLKRLTLELGGNDAAIVLDDVDIQASAKRIFAGSFLNAGQVCVGIKRVYATSTVYDGLCAELAVLAEAAVVGDGLAEATTMGPLQNPAQHTKLLDLLEDSRRHGRIIAGGDRPEGPGYFLRPAIVADIEDGTRLVDEEQFGPLLPIVRVRNADDAVARANASLFALGASVWSGDLDRATALARRLEAGTVWINKHGELLPHVPFAGAKTSGVGVELGEEGLLEYSQLQVINAAVG